MWIKKGKINSKYGVLEKDFGQVFKVESRVLFTTEYHTTIGILVAMNNDQAILFNTTDGDEKVILKLNSDTIFTEISREEYLKLCRENLKNIKQEKKND